MRTSSGAADTLLGLCRLRLFPRLEHFPPPLPDCMRFCLLPPTTDSLRARVRLTLLRIPGGTGSCSLGITLINRGLGYSSQVGQEAVQP